MLEQFNFEKDKNNGVVSLRRNGGGRPAGVDTGSGERGPLVLAIQL